MQVRLRCKLGKKSSAASVTHLTFLPQYHSIFGGGNMDFQLCDCMGNAYEGVCDLRFAMIVCVCA